MTLTGMLCLCILLVNVNFFNAGLAVGTTQRLLKEKANVRSNLDPRFGAEGKNRQNGAYHPEVGDPGIAPVHMCDGGYQKVRRINHQEFMPKGGYVLRDEYFLCNSLCVRRTGSGGPLGPIPLQGHPRSVCFQ